MARALLLRRGPAAFLRGDWAKACGLLARVRLDGYTFWASVFAGTVTWALVTLAAAVLPPPPGPTASEAGAGGTTARWLFAALLATCTAPALEDLYYRGFLLTQLRLAAGRAAAVLLVTALFAAQHVGQFGDASGGVSWPGVFGAAASGLAFALLRIGTGSLAPGVIAHAVYNGINMARLGAPPSPHG